MLFAPALAAIQSKGGEKMESNLEKVGALWQNTSADGKPYFNLDINGQKFVVFSNSYKAEDKQPDFLVYERVKGKPKAEPKAEVKPKK